MSSLFYLATLLVPAVIASPPNVPPDPDAEVDGLRNKRLLGWFFWIWACVISVLMILTFIERGHRYIRNASERQTMFSYRGYTWGFIRKHLIDSPIFRKRHHREFQINSVMNMGTLPSRFQMLFLTLYFAFQLLFLVYGFDLSAPKQKVIHKLISRSGILAVANMLPLFLLAARNNPFIPLCEISFDTFNLIHRWMGRMSAFMAIIHTFLWMTSKAIQNPGNGATIIGISIRSSEFIMTGFIAFICFSVLLITSPSVLRHAFYETFLHIHIVAAAVAVGGLWYHLKRFPVMTTILRVVIGIWVTDRLLRIIRILFYNFGGSRTLTRAKVEVLPGEAVRITCYVARTWAFRPGQHAYLYIPSVGLWSSHPLSISWASSEKQIDTETDHEKGLGPVVSPVSTIMTKELSFICRRRTGFTDKLYRRAAGSPDGEIHLRALVEGPYGSQDLRSFGTVVLFAAGVGITHQIPHVRDLVAAYASGSCATRRVLLVWCIRKQEQLEWVRSWMTEILGMPQRREVLRVQLYVTNPLSAHEIHSPSSSVLMFPGRPKLDQIMATEVRDAIGAVGVSCCGIGDMADDVRRACRTHMDRRAVSFMEESFTW